MPKYIETSEDATRFFEIDPNYSPKESNNNSKQNKIILLEMARNGEPRPSVGSDDLKIKRLGEYLNNYIRQNGESYDKVFAETIRKEASHWFEKSADFNKIKLLEMARNKEPKPSRRSKDGFIKSLGEGLKSYMNKKRNTYNKVFAETIRKEAPENWFGKKYLSFIKARKYVRSLGLKSLIEWLRLCKSGKKPNNIPSTPNKVYKNKGWAGFGDWLGTGNLSNGDKIFVDFIEARKYARSLNLKTKTEWESLGKSRKRPDNIPSCPYYVYKNKGWKGYPDFLGK